MSKPLIKDGYYIKARCIQNSDIANKPPYVREIWDWLLKEANHSDNAKTGIKRGQCMRSFNDIRNGLCWYVGYRKEQYTKWQCEKAAKYLREQGMIATEKTTRGLIITVLNYDKYQNPKNYESNNDSYKKATKDRHYKQECNKNDNNIKELFDYWNAKGVMVHRNLTTKIKGHLNSALEHSSVEDIKGKIDNYEWSYSSPNSWWTQKWSLDKLLTQTTAERFWPDNFEKKDMMNNKKDTGKGLSPGWYRNLK